MKQFFHYQGSSLTPVYFDTLNEATKSANGEAIVFHINADGAIVPMMRVESNGVQIVRMYDTLGMYQLELHKNKRYILHIKNLTRYGASFTLHEMSETKYVSLGFSDITNDILEFIATLIISLQGESKSENKYH